MEKNSKMKTNEKSLSDFSARQQEEALLRLERLTAKFDLKEDILKQFKKGVISYCYMISIEHVGSGGIVDTKCLDPKWRDTIEKFENTHNALVYLALVNKSPYGEMLSMLYVSQYEEEWEWGRGSSNYIAAYVYNFDIGEGEFGEICLTSMDGALIRTM